MKHDHAVFSALTLFTSGGERKYLSAAERERFLVALPVLPDETDRTYCEMLFWTGCRASEALALTALNVDMDEGVVVVRSLKKRGAEKRRHFRQIPVPTPFIQRLDAVHGIAAAQAKPGEVGRKLLWSMSRTTAWRRVRSVMQAAGIHGDKARPKWPTSRSGSRHISGHCAPDV